MILLISITAIILSVLNITWVAYSIKRHQQRTKWLSSDPQTRNAMPTAPWPFRYMDKRYPDWFKNPQNYREDTN